MGLSTIVATIACNVIRINAPSPLVSASCAVDVVLVDVTVLLDANLTVLLLVLLVLGLPVVTVLGLAVLGCELITGYKVIDV